MTLKIAICDDNKDDAKQIEKLLLQYSMQHDNTDFVTETFERAVLLINAVEAGEKYDLILLDIEMPKVDGISAASYIRKNIDFEVPVVFISAYPKYMNDSFRIHPFEFIQKPVKKEAFFRMLDDFITTITKAKKYFTIISDDSTEYSIRTEDIYYLRTEDSKNKLISFHLADKTISTRGTLSSWQEKLKDLPFRMANRTTLINLEHIHYFKDGSVILDNGDPLEISSRNKKKLMNEYLNKVVSGNA